MLGWIALLAGKREVELEFQKAPNLDDVLRRLFDLLSAEFKKQMYDAGKDELRPPPPHILINGKPVTTPRREVELSDGDLVVLVPPVVGG